MHLSFSSSFVAWSSSFFTPVMTKALLPQLGPFIGSKYKKSIKWNTIIHFVSSFRPPYLTLNDKNKTQLKTILYWNEFYGRYDTYDFGFGHEAFIEKNCPYSGCFATKDRHLLPSLDMYDAIIIHIRGLPNDWPTVRSSHQRYIMLSIDAPIKLYEYKHLEKLPFNWTMTYRWFFCKQTAASYYWLQNSVGDSELFPPFKSIWQKEATSQWLCNIWA